MIHNHLTSSLLILCLLSTSVSSVCSEIDKDKEIKRPKIGLVLSGGGARGAAHVGVMKVLEQHNIPIDVIAGTSFGALVGGLYASGYSADELEQVIKDIDWQSALSSQAPRTRRSFRRKQDDDGFLIKFKVGFKDRKLKLPYGLVIPNNLRLMLKELAKDAASIDDFDDLKIPFRAVATNLETGTEVILGDGNLISAMLASMSVPGLFPPLKRDGKLLVDGGVTNNVPVNVARLMGADIVIVVDISTPLMKQDEITSMTSVLDQLTLIMTTKSTDVQLNNLYPQDILIQPELADIGFSDFERALEVIPRGVVAAEKQLEQLKSIAILPLEWASHITQKDIPSAEQPIIDFIKLENDSMIADQIIKSRLSITVGDKFDPFMMSEDLSKIYGLELFDEVNYNLIEEGDQTGLEIRTKRPEIGEDHFRFGLALQEDFSGESGFLLAASHTNLALNRLGGELKSIIQLGDVTGLAAEFYQPLDFAERKYIFVDPFARVSNSNILADDNSGDILAQVRVSELGVKFGYGMNFGEWGTARLGFVRSTGKVRGRIATPGNPSSSFDQSAVLAEFQIDTLDNLEFPHQGALFQFNYQNQLPIFGADSEVDSIVIGGYSPYTWGKNTLGAYYQLASSFNGVPDETNLFPLGGFLSLSSYDLGQLTGNHGGVISGLFYRQISGGSRYLTQAPIYLGGSLEAGNVWNNRADASLDDLRWSSSIFLGADTIIGPVYLGFATGDNNQTSVFLYVGQIF